MFKLRLLKTASSCNHGDFNAHHGLQTLEERMALDRTQWRKNAAYDYLDHLDAEGLAWECLRRNSGYRKDYAAAAIEPNAIDDVIRQQWGLRFRYEPGAFCKRRNDILGTGSRYRARYADPELGAARIIRDSTAQT
ncbi:transcriptional regulator domain-containing protein [Erythrobacter sp. QSSC1-22B]|uniref:transcriptional regulator domain-containing protein n=1 Tax=Erythrobacter sp. QSSC1-22B TaxID=1860125 RepID=UPI0018F88A5E|nr:DUF6499 domain-containing protein [Erythrobacter sp. QSSC1-22B]